MLSLSQNKEKIEFVCLFFHWFGKESPLSTWILAQIRTTTMFCLSFFTFICQTPTTDLYNSSLRRPAGNEMQRLKVPNDWIRESAVAWLDKSGYSDMVCPWHSDATSAAVSEVELCGNNVYEQIPSSPSSSPESLLVIPATLPSRNTNILRTAWGWLLQLTSSTWGE